MPCDTTKNRIIASGTMARITATPQRTTNIEDRA
jgi:hypothetical protein